MSKPPRVSLGSGVVLGTAGHIDHGKTSLVRALTGIDTDRLPEEKRRGITIELGFAPWRIDAEHEASIVDVPGHEAFVRTMVAGAGGIDAVLLVVSAEDGVMPQTREHINVCRLLDVGAAVVALTKIDRLDDLPGGIELASEDVRGALAGTPFAGAAIVPCSATTGQGMDALRDAVVAAVDRLPRRDASGPVILPVDRVFTIRGHGTVVTGTLLSGSIDLRGDQELELVAQGDAPRRTVRARAAQVRSEAKHRVVAGCRVALNLAGIEVGEVAKGDVITRGPVVSQQSVVHARLRHLAGHGVAWRAGTTVELCAGTAHCTAVLDPLWLAPDPESAVADDDATVAPGREALVRVRLGAAIPVWPGQRIVLRAFAEPSGDWSGRTIGGGVVLDPEPSPGRAQRPRWIALARAMDGATEGDRIAALVDDAGVMGIGADALVRRTGVRDLASALAKLAARRGDVVDVGGGDVVHGRCLRPLVDQVIAIVDRFHAANPMQAGIGRATLEGMLGARVAPRVAAAAVAGAVARGALRVIDEQGGLARPGKGLQRGGELPGHMKTILAMVAARGSTPPTLREIAEGTSLSAREVLEMVTSLQRLGKLVRVSDELSLDVATHEGLVATIRDHLREAGTIDVQALKQLTGLSRKFAVPLLEHTDALGLTLRRGDVRVPGPRMR